MQLVCRPLFATLDSLQHKGPDGSLRLCCRSLGQKVFSRPGAGAVKEEEQGWRDSLYRVYKSSQVRAADSGLSSMPAQAQQR